MQREAGGFGSSRYSSRGSREISVKAKNRNSGGRDSDLFEEWLKANPLPDVSLQEVNRNANGGLPLDANDGTIAPAHGFGAYHDSDNEKFRISEGKASIEESCELCLLPDPNKMVEREQEVPTFKKFEAPYGKGNVLDGPVNGSGFGFGDPGLQHLREFSWQETGDLLYQCLCECEDLAWDCEQKRFLEVNPSRGGWRIEFIPPLIQPPASSGCTPREYLQSLRERRELQGNKLLLALLSSNAAALAIFCEGKLLLHKVITAYTVRAKQGKSQLKYLRQGGPGRMTVGGAIRAREVDRFFTRVCEKLDEWGNDIQDCEVLFFSGTTRVWNEVYAVDNPKMLVPRSDSRWCKVPFNVHEPRLREVQRVFYRLSHGSVGFSWHSE
ncbi:unnamed protein product [Calypogeia fissa]